MSATAVFVPKMAACVTSVRLVSPEVLDHLQVAVSMELADRPGSGLSGVPVAPGRYLVRWPELTRPHDCRGRLVYRGAGGPDGVVATMVPVVAVIPYICTNPHLKTSMHSLSSAAGIGEAP